MNIRNARLLLKEFTVGQFRWILNKTAESCKSKELKNRIHYVPHIYQNKNINIDYKLRISKLCDFCEISSSFKNVYNSSTYCR
jgi:hypothetical protein